MSDFDNKVSDFFNDYHIKVKSVPDLYAKTPNQLTVCLPLPLKEFCNAAAGRSSDEAGAEPNGIRITVSDPVKIRNDIFASEPSLRAFILSSDRDWMNIGGGRTVKSKIIGTDDRLINSKGGRSAMLIKFGAQVFIQLGRKYGRDTVKNDIECLTVHEFATRYAIESKVDINRLEMHRGPFPRTFA